MFTECSQNERRIIGLFCNVTQKVCRDLNNKINKSLILESVHRQLSYTHLIAEWWFTYRSCNRSLWLVIPDHLQCLPAHGVSDASTINALPKASRNSETVDEWIRQTYCLRSLRHSGVINSTMLLIYLFQCSLFCTEIFECAKITSWSQKTKKPRAVARKPRDTAAAPFGLKFADNIYYKFNRGRSRIFEKGIRIRREARRQRRRREWRECGGVSLPSRLGGLRERRKLPPAANDFGAFLQQFHAISCIF